MHWGAPHKPPLSVFPPGAGIDPGIVRPYYVASDCLGGVFSGEQWVLRVIDIKWGKQYSVGNEAIDRQHQVFIDLIRSTSGAIDSHRSKEFVRRGLEELTLYAKFHFFSEEALMINSNYPGYESHRQEHIELLSAFEEKIYE